MADGTELAIEKIRKGDKILAFDTHTDSLVRTVVTKTFVHPPEATAYTLVINGSLRATPNHPFFANHAWVRADHLKPGDRIIVLDNHDFKSDTIRSIKNAKGHVTTYNIEVNGVHDYFANGLLVHNKFPFCTDQY